MPCYENVSGIVLRKADYRDYDRMITLLTAEKGKIDAVVRGCRRQKSELKNAAEPFVCGEFQLFEKDERFSVTQCRITEGFYPLRTDYDRLTLGAQWLRTADKFSAEDSPSPLLFHLLLDALSYLSFSELPPSLLDTMWKLKLSYINGFAPCADKCALCGKSAEETTLGFNAEKGGCVCPNCAKSALPLSEGARRILMKAPRTPFKSVEKLLGHPNVEEAGNRIDDIVRRFEMF